MGATPDHQARPVLARVSLVQTFHLSPDVLRRTGLIPVLDDLHPIPALSLLPEAGQVIPEHHVGPISEDRKALKPADIRNGEPYLAEGVRPVRLDPQGLTYIWGKNYKLYRNRTRRN